MRRRSTLRALLALLPALLWVEPALATECAGQAWVESTLYMGRGQGEAGGVSDAETKAFVDQAIVPQFPDGFTLFDARGHWRDSKSGRSVNETTLVFVVVHPPGAAADAALRGIADAYIERFHQSVVLGSSQPACVTFYERK